MAGKPTKEPWLEMLSLQDPHTALLPDWKFADCSQKQQKPEEPEVLQQGDVHSDGAGETEEVHRVCVSAAGSHAGVRMQCIWCTSITHFSTASSASVFPSQMEQLGGTRQVFRIWDKALSIRNTHSQILVAASGNGKINCGLTCGSEKKIDEPLQPTNSYSVTLWALHFVSWDVQYLLMDLFPMNQEGSARHITGMA